MRLAQRHERRHRRLRQAQGPPPRALRPAPQPGRPPGEAAVRRAAVRGGHHVARRAAAVRDPALAAALRAGHRGDPVTDSGRQYPDGPLEAPPGWALLDDWPECSLSFWPEAAWAFLFGDPEPSPGPPYTHTFVPPQQAVFTASGKLLYRPPPPGPAWT